MKPRSPEKLRLLVPGFLSLVALSTVPFVGVLGARLRSQRKQPAANALINPARKQPARRVTEEGIHRQVLFHNGHIVTCLPGLDWASAEPKLAEYSWMLVDGDHICALGSGNPPLSTVSRVDLAGRLVLPGLFDSHCHVFYQGLLGQSLILEGTRSIMLLQARLRAYREANPDAQVIYGNQWDQELLGRFPTRHDLDAAVPNVPVVLYRRCWHVCVVNSAALKACNISGNESVIGGEVEVDSVGRPTGILREAAMDKFLRPLKGVGTPEDDRAVLQTGMAHFLQHGCTSVLTNDGLEIGGIREPWERYNELAESDSLPIRIFLTIDWKVLDRAATDAIKLAQFNEKLKTLQWGSCVKDNFSVFRVKLWTDGALGASTAALEQPYSDDPLGANLGILQLEPTKIRHAINLAMKSSLGVEAHTIGDRSARALVEAFEELGVEPQHRYTMTHCQILSEDLILRMAALGVVASIQPQFTASDAPIVRQRLGGGARFRTSYAWRSLRRQGVHLAGGSDAPVEKPAPLEGMYRAMVNDVHLDESLSFAEALEMYTLGAAYAAFREADLGALATGYCADFVITSLQGGLEEVSKPEVFQAAKVQEVWVGGKRQFACQEGDALEPALHPEGPGKSGQYAWVRGPCPACGEVHMTRSE